MSDGRTHFEQCYLVHHDCAHALIAELTLAKKDLEAERRVLRAALKGLALAAGRVSEQSGILSLNSPLKKAWIALGLKS
jgi:hypothetical protein